MVYHRKTIKDCSVGISGADLTALVIMPQTCGGPNDNRLPMERIGMMKYKTDLGAMLSDSAVAHERTVSGSFRPVIVRRSEKVKIMALENIHPFRMDEYEIAWQCRKAGYK